MSGGDMRDLSRPLLRCPELSLVVVAYNMARELPRTIRTLSTDYQRGVEAGEVEVIVVDNGSTRPFDEDACRRWIPDLKILRMENPTVSPVAAINRGIEAAQGNLIGVFIDGARMASPGLLRAALMAARLHERPVIGTLAFHLGPDVQMRSVREGYDQEAEDTLLAGSGWEEDGYRLFDISVFAGSSARGWFQVPAETNALFLTAAHWRELGGYDPRFRTPGGGLANLDTWKRAVESEGCFPVMLLGEGTFHQVHGGVATNALKPPTAEFREEYAALRGGPYVIPQAQVHLFGSFPANAQKSLVASLEKMR